MAASLQSLRLLSAILLVAAADPAPGRVPKVYNALITSNQNLEPSKAHPVYQPVLHDAVYSVQPSFLYGGHFPFASPGLLPLPIHPAPPSPSGTVPVQPTPAPSTPEPAPAEPSTEAPASETEQASPSPDTPSDSTTEPPRPPNTESPIPLNEFGLPPQVVPLGRIDPAYSGFNHLGQLTYPSYSYPSYSAYPGVRLYDPFDPFSFGPYSFPLYRPLPNVLGPSSPFIPRFPVPAAPAPAPAAPASGDQASQTPPSEPSDLNVLNYSSKDPAIPNVPPPPLPQGGLKSDKNE